MRSVTVGGPGLVAVGGDEPDAVAAMGGHRAAVWTSPDGYTWTRVPHDQAVFGGVAGDEQSMSDVVDTGGGLIAVGGTVWTSPDGISWTRLRGEGLLAGLDDPSISAVTVGGPGLVAVGSNEVEFTQWGPLRDGAVWAGETEG